MATPTPSPTASPTATPARTPATPGPTLTPAPPVDFTQDDALQAVIDGVLGDQRDHFGIYVKRLDDGTGASIDPGRVYGTASLFKVYVMWEAFKEREAGLIDFSDTMLVTPYYKSWELGTNLVQVGDEVTIDFALKAMMSVSDTPTGVLLQDTLGIDAIDASLRDLGIVQSGLYYPEDNAVTARDFGVLLEAIYRGTGVTQTSRDEMIDLLLSEQIDHGLRAGVPQGVAVAHKTAYLPGAYHDGGIVFSPGGDYVIVILSDGLAIDRFSALSSAVYAYFNP
jgi:beta-lactamase class A